ncbi:membrane protein DedA, SNARE-associated domain [Alicyclobacillus hesperidum]|uniref:Membrane protein DedA, SNARE-associated domain n=1 Tax=Alicyclobacillus hesperidum TaxID=89784 RepID=A0A1H2RK03_9BACL|nr:membrane protein DedA, SNARE-associated domain [Alicyclobacillus hesperidum]
MRFGFQRRTERGIVVSHLHLFIVQHGLLAIFVLMALESCCIPIPSEVVMPLAGFLAFRHLIGFWPALIVGTIANLVGSLIAYAIGDYGGRPFVLRYGRYIGLNARHLDKAEHWFNRFGEVTVFFGRMVPAVRTFVSLPAGFARMRMGRFIVFSLIGSAIWNLGMLYAGYQLNKNWQVFADHVKPFTYVGAVILVIAVIAFWMRRKSGQGLE